MAASGKVPQELSLDVFHVKAHCRTGARSLALLAFLPDAEREAASEANAGFYGKFGLDEAAIGEMVLESRSLGYALNDGRVLEGMTAVEIPIRDAGNRVVAPVEWRRSAAGWQASKGLSFWRRFPERWRACFRCRSEATEPTLAFLGFVRAAPLWSLI